MTILLVEDNDGDQKLFSMALADSKDTALEIVGDGHEALQFLQKEGKHTAAPTPDLIVLDINLPRVNGLEVLAEIRRNSTLKHIPVVMLTSASPTDVTRERCKEANLYIVKPDGMERYFLIARALVEFCRKALVSRASMKQWANDCRASLHDASCPDVLVFDGASATSSFI